MQQYRVNFTLLIGLLVGALVVVGGGYGLWRFQVDRNAGRLLTRADEAEAEGDLPKTAGLLFEYLRIRKDDAEVHERFANTFAEIAEDPSVQRKDLAMALQRLEMTVRDQPDNDKLRRRLVDLLMAPHVPGLKDALDHINYLLNRNPGDPELELLKSQCLFAVSDRGAMDHAYRLIGFDEATETFEPEKAVAPNDPMVYARVANILREDEHEQELAEEMIERMVEANPESGQAYLIRARLREQKNEDDAAEADVARALELSPNDPSVVVTNARLLAKKERFEEARELLIGAIKENPETPFLYQTLAGIDLRLEDYESALSRFDEGIESVSPRASAELKFYRTRLQIERGDSDQVAAEIETMRKDGVMAAPFLDYLSARLEMANNEWFAAAQELERLRPFLAERAELNVESLWLLGFCYEKLGQWERAAETYQLTLQSDPDNELARLGLIRSKSQIGRGTGSEEVSSIYERLSRELDKPESEQDWNAFNEEIAQYVDVYNLSDAMEIILQGEVLMRRGKFAESRKKLLEAYRMAPNDLGVRRAAVKLFAADPEQGPVKALKLLDKVVADFDDLPILRLERADLYIAINDENLTEQLMSLTDDLDAMTRDQKIQLWTGLSKKFAQLRDRESQTYCLRQVADLAPSDLVALLQLFMTAREQDDEAGMRDAQDRILEVVGSQENPTWMFTEANRLVADYRATREGPEALTKAKELIDRTIDERPEWNQPLLLDAEISLLRGQESKALASYDRGSKLGRPSALGLFQHVKLLMRYGRYQDALKEMEQVNRGSRLLLLGQDYAEALFRSGQLEEAIAVAREISSNTVNNADRQLWLGRFLASAVATPQAKQDFSEERRAKLITDAGEAFNRSVEIEPASAENWLAQITFLLMSGQKGKAEDAIRSAQLAITEDQVTLLTARCYEVVGRWLDAESMYRLAHERVPDDPKTARLLAQFYLGKGYPRDNGRELARPLINDILRSAAEGETNPNDQNVTWARRMGANLLSQTGEYLSLLDAERLLSSNAKDGLMAQEDKAMMAQILANRPEPLSRLKAVKLFEELRSGGLSSVQSEMVLAKLYASLGQWEKCRDHMIDMIGARPTDPNVRKLYLALLINQGTPEAIDTAARQVRRLHELAPEDPATRDLVARVAYKRGETQNAVKAARSMLPSNLRSLEPGDLPTVKRVARLLTEFEQYDTAEGLYALAASLGGVSEKLALATFVGQHRDLEKGFDTLEGLRGESSAVGLVQQGIAVLRHRAEQSDSGQIDQEYLSRVSGWLDSALRDNPEQISLLLHKAELLDLQGKPLESAETYRVLLESDKLRNVSRAVVLNNLAYLLSVTVGTPDATAEALEHVDEAISIIGPTSDVLDTRAVAYLAADKADEAVEDLKLAVIDKPTPSKYFHKAVAHMMSNDQDDALEAWKKAVELGLSRDDLPRVEREQYDQLKSDLENRGLLSASL
ncbi:bacteriophage N4 receptor, outer membrane subunit [Pseudobythopirellula maris]|uniref:Bacteriophage N4 receptor, outer membrane subunit n=1 Tax=Pseudobythopirellula maris TaxID=2527991 RepID=A0A5C5ZS03_9BACT|nr:tetratricopeptide repeat protein [Pseudobythopirellula maris]TWT89013.1 bacteriophage N4 receptor, outer membrane subunit [Pseudobythopirellula maris]